MDQIITLLTNLFNLTKVASVTLPGLLAAGGLALILWPAVPVDVIPVVTAMSDYRGTVADNAPHLQPPYVSPSPRPSNKEVPIFPQAFSHACDIGHSALNDVPDRMKSEWYRANNYQGIDPCKEPYNAPPRKSWLSDAACQFQDLEKHSNAELVPESRKRAIKEQFVLDFEARNLAACVDLEKSWQGQEEKDVQQLTADADILEKQRSAAQDSYLAYQKSNDKVLERRYESAMDDAKARIDTVRNTIQGRDRDLQERGLRVNELDTDEQIIAERLKDPGRLRPRVGFDLFVTGLVSHVVGFILLSLAAAIVVTAIDRAAFGAFFEDLFDGF